MYSDISGYAPNWGAIGWGIATLIVVVLVVATIVTAGGVLAGYSSLMLASSGLASATPGLTILAFATVGASLAYFGSAFVAATSSNSVDEFLDYGLGALLATSTGGLYGAIGGAISYKQQIAKESGTWASKRQRYWNSLGYKKTPNGVDGKSMVLHHPFGRYGAKEDIFIPVTRTEHTQIHSVLGYGRGNGGFNQYYQFDNIWSYLTDYIK